MRKHPTLPAKVCKSDINPVEFRNGYLMIFWSLILVIAMVPIMVRTLENSIYVRSEIKAWDTWEDSMGVLGNRNYLTMKKEEKNGMGYFKYGVVEDLADKLPDSLPEGDDYVYTYDYASASTMPVPTLYGTNYIVGDKWNDYVNSAIGSTRLGCNDVMEGFFPEISFWKTCDEYKVFEADGVWFVADKDYKQEDAIATGAAPNYLYTVPMIGTGDAGPNAEKCSWTLPNSTAGFDTSNRYKDGPVDENYKYVDFLDDPCNWDKIYPSEVIAIPLFVRDPADPSKTIILGLKEDGSDILVPGRTDGAKLLSLRFRMPCLDTDVFCREEDRMIIDLPITTSETRNDVLDLIDQIERDSTNKLIDWAVVDYAGIDPTAETNIFRPSEEARLDEGTKFLRRPLVNPVRFTLWRNYEITTQRFRVDSRLIDGTAFTRGEFFIRYIAGTGITTFNLLSNKDTDGDFIQLRDAAGLARMNSSPILNFNKLLKRTRPLSNETTIGADQYNMKYPFLVLKLENWPEKIVSEPQTAKRSSENLKYKIPYMEFQLVSDRPLGNNKQYVQGRIKHPSGKTFMRVKESAKVPSAKYAPQDTGTVFTN